MEEKRKKIEPGRYGAVLLYINDAVGIPPSYYTPEQLREAAHILNQIAEYLEGEK